MQRKLFFFALSALAGAPLSGQTLFSDVSPAAGLPTRAGGENISVVDYDNDGWEDIYVGFTTGSNELWRNNGDGTFTEVAATANLQLGPATRTKAAVWGDFDNDGDADLYAGNLDAADQLLQNNGDGTFTDITAAAGLGQTGHPLSVNLTDYDRDGWLDIYVTNFLLENILYRNNGDGTFTDVTEAAGVPDDDKSMGTLFFDYDLDGDADLYLVHDGFAPNILYRNNDDGTFTDVSVASGTNTESFGMGVDAADLNGDGWPDLYITNLYQNYLLYNDGDGTFTEYSTFAGVGDNGMGWGTTLLDYDDDGHVDIYACNDFGFSSFPNVLYRNDGNGAFLPQETSVVANTGKSYGTATLDFDHDGRPDLAVTNRGAQEHWQLFRNEQTSGNRLVFHLTGTDSNRAAIGAVLTFTDDRGRTHTDEIHAGHGWTSQNSKDLHFGLNDAAGLVAGEITWPSGLRQPLPALDANGYYSVVEGTAPALVRALPTGTTSTGDQSTATTPSVLLYPNPASPFAWVSTTTGELIRHVDILSVSGRTLLTVQPPQPTPTLRIDLTAITGTAPLMVITTTERGQRSWQLLVR